MTYTTKTSTDLCFNCGVKQEFEDTYNSKGRLVEKMCTVCEVVDDFPSED